MPLSVATLLLRKRLCLPKLPRGRFIAAIVALGSAELMASIELTIGIVALPKIQNELNLSSAGRNWVVFATLLACNGLILVGGRLGDTIGRKRAFVIGTVLSTVASVMSAIAWDEGSLVLARMLKGVAIAIVAPTCLAWSRRRSRRAVCATARWRCSPRWASVGSVLGLVVGGIITEVSWRLAVFVTAPIGLLALYLAHIALRETQKERMKLDATGAVLATLGCHRGGFRLLDGVGEGLAVGRHHRVRCGGSGGFHRVRRGRAQGGEPGPAVQLVRRPQSAGHVRGLVSHRWGDS